MTCTTVRAIHHSIAAWPLSYILATAAHTDLQLSTPEDTKTCETSTTTSIVQGLRCARYSACVLNPVCSLRASRGDAMLP